MKMTLILILPTLLLFSVPIDMPGVPAMHPSAAITWQSPDPEHAPHIANTTIEPGLSIGPIKLGDSRDRALELFPKKDEDQQWEDSCGSTIDWVDTTNPMGRGDLNIRMKKGKIFQIESSTSRLETPDFINDSAATEK